MSTDKTYNGWTNYETWAVALWLDNEQGTQEHWRERAAYWLENAEPLKLLPADSDTNKQENRAAYELSKELKDQHEEQSQEMLESYSLGSSLWADLLGAALSEVNWREIAEHFVDGELEEQAHKLKNVEFFEVTPARFLNAEAGSWLADALAQDGEGLTDTPDRNDAAERLAGWYYWTCCPGCLPDSEANGPFTSEQDARKDAMENS